MRPLLCLHGLYCCSSPCHGQYLFYWPGQYSEPPCPYHDQSRSPPYRPCYEHQYHESQFLLVMINPHIIDVMTRAHTGGESVRRGSLLRRTDPAKTSWRGGRRCRGLPTGRRSLGTPLIRVKKMLIRVMFSEIMYHVSQKTRGAFFDIYRKRCNLFM